MIESLTSSCCSVEGIDWNAVIQSGSLLPTPAISDFQFYTKGESLDCLSVSRCHNHGEVRFLEPRPKHEWFSQILSSYLKTTMSKKDFARDNIMDVQNTVDATMSPNDSTNTSRAAMVAGILGAGLGLPVLLGAPFVVMQLRSSLPWMACPPAKVASAIQHIERKLLASCDRVKPFRFYDLGSGDGSAVLTAAKLGWRSTGVELNSTLWMISGLRRQWTTSGMDRRLCNFVWGDMWKQSLHDADAVMIFGVKPLMPMIAKKLQTECAPGTFVLSYRFLVPIASEHDAIVAKGDIGQDRVENSQLLDATLIYDQEEMRIYQIRGPEREKTDE